MSMFVGYPRGGFDDDMLGVSSGGVGVYDEEDYEDEMMVAALGARGGQLSAQATAELYAKKLLHRDFYNDFTDDCDEDDLD